MGYSYSMSQAQLKPLDWKPLGSFKSEIVSHAIAETPFCCYKVHADNHGGYVEIQGRDGVEFVNCETFDGGKAIAADHHQQQVKGLYENAIGC